MGHGSADYASVVSRHSVRSETEQRNLGETVDLQPGLPVIADPPIPRPTMEATPLRTDPHWSIGGVSPLISRALPLPTKIGARRLPCTRSTVLVRQRRYS